MGAYINPLRPDLLEDRRLLLETLRELLISVRSWLEDASVALADAEIDGAPARAVEHASDAAARAWTLVSYALEHEQVRAVATGE